MLGHSLLGKADEGGSGGVALPAALTAAVALLSAVDDDQVSGLAGGGSALELSAQNQPAANAGAQGHHGKVLRALAHAGEILAHGGAVCVIAQVQRAVKVLAEELLQGDIFHGDVGEVTDIAAVHAAGHTHAHPGDLLQSNTALGGNGLGKPCHNFGKLLRVLIIQRDPLHFHNIARFIHKAGLQVGAAYVDTNVIHSLVPRFVIY